MLNIYMLILSKTNHILIILWKLIMRINMLLLIIAN